MEDLMDMYLGDEVGECVDDVQQCCDDPFICKDIANYVCKNCGMCGDPVYTYFRNVNYYVKKKSIHSRTRWFSNMLVDYVNDYDDREVLTSDFQTLARTYEKYDLLDGRNLSREPRGVKSKRALIKFDKKFKIACEILGW